MTTTDRARLIEAVQANCHIADARGAADLTLCIYLLQMPKVCGDELARGLAAPPAALHGTTVMLRRASLRRWLYEKYEAWTLKRQPGPFRAALDARGFDGRDGAAAIERMAELDAETQVLHELGEFEAGRRLDPDWQALRGALPSRRADFFVRATRDHLADCLVTLPALLRRREPGALHFWFANLEGVRELLFPRLWPAYAAWCDGDGGAALEAAVAAGVVHWGRACERLLALHRRQGEEAAAFTPSQGSLRGMA